MLPRDVARPHLDRLIATFYCLKKDILYKNVNNEKLTFVLECSEDVFFYHAHRFS